MELTIIETSAYLELKRQLVVRASGGSRPENGSTCSGQMNGRAGGMPGIGNLEEVSPGLP
mgnify:CR=1 FL=1